MGTSTHASNVVVINRATDAVVTVDMQSAFMHEHTWTEPVGPCLHHLFDGGLPVKDGHLIVPTVLEVEKKFDLRYATLDQHPKGHVSLASSYDGIAPGTVLTANEVGQWVPPGCVGSEMPGVVHCIGQDALFTLVDLQRYLQEIGSQILWPDHALIGTIEAELHPALDWLRYRHVQTKGSDPKVDSYSGFFDNAGHATGLGARMRADGVENVFVQGLAEDFCVGWTAIGAKKLGFKNVYLISDATKPVDMPGTRDKMHADLAAAGVEMITSSQLVPA